MILHKVNICQGEVTVPGDKSISHRGVMFGALSKGTTNLSGFLMGADCLSTISCFKQMGIDIDVDLPNHFVSIKGKGLHGLSAPDDVLYTGNSGTTTRILSGILCGQDFRSVINGDDSIQKRPMKRVITPLSMMNANIRSLKGNDCTPLEIIGHPLHSTTYFSPVASAQVKSAVLLAGLYAYDGPTTVSEPAVSRNHTELMLTEFGGKIDCVGCVSTVYPDPVLEARDITIPGDISSAAYFIAAGLITPNSEIYIRNVGVNPTRDGIIKVAQEMGGSIEFINYKKDGEPVADLLVKSSSLHGITIGGKIIPTLIDELPVIAIMAAMADGTTIIKDAAELKVKESDRIAVVTENLLAMGAKVTPTDDGMIIEGTGALHGAKINPHLDHRIAMSFAVASLVADGETEIMDADCVNISYPTFYSDLSRLSR